jgi:hypothetical protein
MRLRRADRRRLVFASVLTAVVFPAVWWENNEDSASNRPTVAAVGLGSDGAVSTSTTIPAPAIEPAYLGAAGTPPSLPPSATLLVGPSNDDLVATTRASFDNRLDRDDVCWFGGVGDGDVITVVNQANGQSLECLVVGRDLDAPDVVVLGPAAFVRLADFTDAPIHVEVRQ